MQQSWRLIPETVASGVTHMAIDTWLLNGLITGYGVPTLRFYRWSPIAVSLGYHQRRWPEHWQALSWQGQPIELVKRPTGGRAVLHQGDFTYALTMSIDGVSRQDLYHSICEALIAAWEKIGVSLTYGTAGREYYHQPNCFATATPADLVTSTGYKLVGSAQLRRDRCLLQQGTMRLWPNPALYQQVFGESVDSPQLADILPEHPSQAWLQQVSDLIVEALGKQFGVVFKEKPLTGDEQQRAMKAYGEDVIPQRF